MRWRSTVISAWTFLCIFSGGFWGDAAMSDRNCTFQRFDGFHNSIFRPELGAAGRPLARNITSAYGDNTYMASGGDRPCPRKLSNLVFKGKSGIRNRRNLTALFAFFGQLVQRELTSTDDTSCPPEILEVSVPRHDPDFDPDGRGDRKMPYERRAYDRKTGQSPNSPRRQLNKASSYIDGSFLYGNSIVRTAYLRDSNSGKLACQDKHCMYPLLNDVRLPFQMYPTRNKTILVPETLWRLGDTHVYENPWLLSLNLLFFKYHNTVAESLAQHHQNWTSDEIFDKTRHWVIAVLQKIIMYDWLPLLVNEPIKSYPGYNPSIISEITDLFDAAAINYIMTLIPSASYSLSLKKTEENKCILMGPHRLCNTYWNSKEILESSMLGTSEFLLGLTAQSAEADDTVIVEDLRSKFYGPLFYSRHDAVVLTIMKGRDYGLPDYNTARRHMGLPPIANFSWPNRTAESQKLFECHNSMDTVDIFVGGMMETTAEGPGPLFKSIILDQMYRVRDGDRFWFENTANGLFSEEEVGMIMNTTLSDVIMNATEIKLSMHIKGDVFLMPNDLPCNGTLEIDQDSLEECPAHDGYDYFEGSEIPYIIIWTCVGLLPLVVVLFAYILSKCKRWQYNRQLNEARAERERRRQLRRTLSCSVSVIDAKEWRGLEAPRGVELHLTTKDTLEVFTTMGSHLRTIKLSTLSYDNVTLSSNKKRNVMLVQVPKEYDLVVVFANEEERNQFVEQLVEFLADYNIDEGIFPNIPEKELYKMAVTKEKRNAMLEKFFKTIFKEAFQMDYDPALDSAQMDVKKHTKEILEVELSKEEFAEAIGSKAGSDFVEHFFSLIDSDRNGYISFREFLNAVVLFSKGSCQDKLQTMFYMYDIEASGIMSKTDIGKMFRSLLELAQSKPDAQEVERLVESLVLKAGLQHKTEFTFDDFCQILAPQMDKLWNASFDWKGVPERSKVISNKSGKSSKKSEGDNVRQRSPSLGNVLDGSATKSGRLLFESVREHYSPLKARVKLIKHFIENFRQHIFFLILFYGIVFGLFAERFYYYTVEREESGLRLLMSYGISMTRGAAAAVSFTFCFLLLTMCRNSITYLRSTGFNQIIPFDSHVSFHKIVAWTALFFTAVHVLGYSFNFYHLVTQPTSFLCIFDSIIFRAEFVPTFQWWLFGTLTGFTGVLLVLVIVILYVFATQTARRHIFSLFWMTHKLFIALYVLTLIHGASVIVQKPLFFAYLVGPAALFMLDKLVSLSRKKTELSIVRAQNLPSDVTMIEFKRPPRFEYKSGMWVRIACLSQGKDEYHPFTLTSAPHEDTLKVHIRALGPWTWNIRQTFDPENSGPGRFPKLYLDGPYGAGQQDWYQYEVSVLVGAGIGVTPYASILKDFVHMSSIKCTYKVKCQKLYFIWITGSQRHFEWLLDILREVEEVDQLGMVDIDIFITQFFQNFDLRTALLYIFEEHFQKMTGGKSVFTGLKATTHFGRPQMNKIMTSVHKAHPQVRKVGVFSCGPRGVTKGVERACMEASKTTKALFEHHFENF